MYLLTEVKRGGNRQRVRALKKRQGAPCKWKTWRGKYQGGGSISGTDRKRGKGGNKVQRERELRDAWDSETRTGRKPKRAEEKNPRGE